MTSKIGFVYVLTNESMPGLVKIGFTLGRPADRAKQLATTGVPTPFVVAYSIKLFDPDKWERRIHEHLVQHRKNKEWFSCDFEYAKAKILSLIPGDATVAAEHSEAEALKHRVTALAEQTYEHHLKAEDGLRLWYVRDTLGPTIGEFYKRRLAQLAFDDLRSLFADKSVLKLLRDEEVQAMASLSRLCFAPKWSLSEWVRYNVSEVEKGHRFPIGLAERRLGRHAEQQETEKARKSSYLFHWWQSVYVNFSADVLRHSIDLHPVVKQILVWAVAEFHSGNGYSMRMSSADTEKAINSLLSIKHHQNIQSLVDARLKQLAR